MLDAVHTWEHPVTIRLGGVDHSIAAPVQASHILFVEWPVDRTDKHKAASQACKAAMEGASPEVARAAFIDATIEAGLFIS
jgi:hypothetical protein